MTNIDLLRLAFERRFPIVAARFQQPTPPMRAYLAIPIETRLILLALHDGADEAAVKTALPYAKQTDVRKTSKEVVAALETLKQGLLDPLFFIDLGDIPLETDHEGDLTDPTTKTLCRDADIPETIERTFRQIWYPSAAPMLIGPMVYGGLAEWSLRERLMTYCLVTEELERAEVMEIFGCSAWAVRAVIEKGMKEFAKEIATYDQH